MTGPAIYCASGYMQSDDGFYTGSTSPYAVQAPAGGVHQGPYVGSPRGVVRVSGQGQVGGGGRGAQLLGVREPGGLRAQLGVLPR